MQIITRIHRMDEKIKKEYSVCQIGNPGAISFSFFYKKLVKWCNLMKSDKMKYVTIDILDADDDSPASLSFSAVKSLEDFEEIDYDPVEAIPESPLR